MTEKKGIMVMAEKESFVVKALIKKIIDAGHKATYVKPSINDLNNIWDENALLVYYMDNNDCLSAETERFVADKLTDSDVEFIIIGDPGDVKQVCDGLSHNFVLKTFKRPLDNESFMATVEDVFKGIAYENRKKSILIIDDDPTYMGLVRDWLKGTYKVSMAVSGLQGIKWLGSNKADLVLLDFEMPVTNGPKVLEMLKSDYETKNIPVIFLTGKSDKASVMEVVALKADGYLLKSIEREELLKQLFEFFEKRKG
ncbi:MAG: response regulator [Lachnospiraceae bacterium]|nr:response regulator [Lachnospiraceae bacterium]